MCGAIAATAGARGALRTSSAFANIAYRPSR